ncbi:MAG: 4-hydroxy-3-methylbut-2-enyl diphosphate reductase, partial [bacterium]|nr:4-hydroxy-3-methylbut-2-enyl diphosphate reductase [bacterium]
MKVLLANPTGMCFGVKRAIAKAEGLANQADAYCLGMLVHNRQVLEYLTSLGLKILDEQTIVPGSSVVIRAHGTSPETIQSLEALGCQVVDATCPFVKRLQEIATHYVVAGYVVLLVGDSAHPEVMAVQAHASGKIIIIDNYTQIPAIPMESRVVVLAQTTTPMEIWREVVDVLLKKGLFVEGIETICSATSERRRSAYELASQVDIMIVVGGNNSANTKNLTTLCAGLGTPTFQIESSDELQDDWFKGA